LWFLVPFLSFSLQNRVSLLLTDSSHSWSQNDGYFYSTIFLGLLSRLI
jgi:hypothetical protein